MGEELSRRDALLAAGAVVAGSSIPTPAAAAGIDGNIPDLAGKTVVVQTRSRPLSNPVVLGECQFESQGGRVFLVGVRQPCALHLPSWTDGIHCYIAWDCIEEYMVFNSLSDYHSRLHPPKEDDSEAEGNRTGCADPNAADVRPRD